MGLIIRAVRAVQAPTVPSYISSMSDFQVRSLTGTYAPTNGSSTLNALLSSTWNDFPTENNTDIMRPWCGGPKMPTGTKAWVHGGGHTDSANNAIVSFDFAGTTKPTGWAIENAGDTSHPADFTVGTTGKPISVHTYDGMCYLNGKIYRLGGSPYPDGSPFSNQFLSLQVASPGSDWTRLPDWPGGGFGGMAIANESANKILVLERQNFDFAYAFYRAGSNDWSAKKNVATQWLDYGGLAIDTTTGNCLCVGGDNGLGTTAFSVVPDWSAETITQTAKSIAGIAGGCSHYYDPTKDCFWAYGGEGDSSTIYEINKTTFGVTSHALTGDAITPESPNSRGHFGRGVFMNSYRAIGSVASRTQPAYVIKLPN
jgi:hypothetical protein